MRRVSVVGTSGAGKSTLARALAKRLSVPYVELDAFMHQPSWQLRPDAEFMALVEKATAEDQPGWVVDCNYRRFVIEGPVWKRADTGGLAGPTPTHSDAAHDREDRAPSRDERGAVERES